MIKIGYEKLFTQTELLESLKKYLSRELVEDIDNGKCDFEIEVVAVMLDEKIEFIRGFIKAGK